MRTSAGQTVSYFVSLAKLFVVCPVKRTAEEPDEDPEKKKQRTDIEVK